LGELAEGKGRNGKPKHPYQVDGLKRLEERIMGRPTSPEPQLNVNVPAGDVVIVWRAGD
jgi:hypothetical protein